MLKFPGLEALMRCGVGTGRNPEDIPTVPMSVRCLLLALQGQLPQRCLDHPIEKPSSTGADHSFTLHNFVVPAPNTFCRDPSLLVDYYPIVAMMF
jgi:hypothetical protein